MGAGRSGPSGISPGNDPYSKRTSGVEIWFHPVLTMEEQFISYGRFDGRETILVLMNNAQEERKVEIPVWWAEVPEEAETGMPDGNQ